MSHLLHKIIFKLICLYAIFQMKNKIFINSQEVKEIPSSVLYDKFFITENSITGTGNILRDSAYYSSCIAKNCTYCCEGLIEEMTCANRETCKKYKEYKARKLILRIILILIFPYLLIPAFWIFIHCTKMDRNSIFLINFSKFFEIYVGILLPCYGIYILFNKLFKCDASIENKIELIIQHKGNFPSRKDIELFREKEFHPIQFSPNLNDNKQAAALENASLEPKVYKNINNANKSPNHIQRENIEMGQININLMKNENNEENKNFYLDNREIYDFRLSNNDSGSS
jgi:hypothetical protein